MKKVILTGDRPTGRLHVGHYVGSLKERVRLQNTGEYDEIFIMIADAQALTDNADNPEKVRQNILQVALDYLACGLDPNKVHIFIQSMVPQLTELSFYYQNLVTVSRLQRNPTVKSEIQMRNFEASIPVEMCIRDRQLAAEGIHARVINIHTIKPLDEEIVIKAAKECGKVITAEEHNVIGGLGEAVCAVLSEKQPTPVRRVGVQDVFGCSGPAWDLLKKFGLDAATICKTAHEMLGK